MRNGIVVGGALVLLAGGIAWRVVATVKKEQAGKAALAAAAKTELERPQPIRVAAVARRDVADRVVVTGAVRPRNEVDVYAKIPGRLESVSARLGDAVRAGQVLAVVEHRELAWQQKAAEAAVELAKANLELAEGNLARTEPLLKSGSATEQQVAALRSAVAIAKAQAAQVEATAGLAATNLSNAWIIAPVSGVVTRRSCNPGTMATQAMPLFQIHETAEMKLEAGVDARTRAALQLGRPVSVAVEAWPGERFAGRISAIQPALDPLTRRSLVEVTLPNPKGRLVANMFARAEIELGTLQNVLSVPRSALVEQDGEVKVYAVRDGQVVVLTPRVLADDGSFAGVDGLGEADRVAVQGQQQLRAGAKVDAVPADGS